MSQKRDIWVRGILLTAALLVLTALPVMAQTSACEGFPESAYWSNVTHKSVTSYVQRKHDGDWAPYLTKWSKQLHSMQEIDKRGGSAVFKSKGLTLSGDDLKSYIADIEKRVAVIRCLSEQP